MSDPQALHRGLALYRSGELVEAEAVFRSLVESNAANATAIHLLGVVLHSLGRDDEALIHLRRSLDIDPKNAGFWNNLGGVQRKVGLLREAEQSFDRAIARQPTLAEAHYNRGLTLRALDREAAARDSFRMALMHQPKYADAHFQLGLLAISVKDDAAAQTHFRDALTNQPNHSDAAGALAESLMREGKFAEALPPSLALADQVGSRQAHWQNVAGSLYSKLGQKPLALKHFQRSVELDAESSDAWTNLGITRHELGDSAAGREAIEKAISIEPNHELATFFRDSMAGLTPAAAPRKFVSGLFDDYADHFDQHLTQRLGYQTPQLLADLVAPHIGGRIGRLLDLGCGTGLSGAAFAQLADEMIGVDLSAQMLKRAAERKLYRELICEDVVKQTETFVNAFDLILAADVFVYIGDLGPMFHAAHGALASGGLFAFSVEIEATEQDYRLLPSRRYAHRLSYLQRLAEQTGFDWVESRNSVIRRERNQPIAGSLVALRRV